MICIGGARRFAAQRPWACNNDHRKMGIGGNATATAQQLKAAA
jgi:hypothetical protein